MNERDFSSTLEATLSLLGWRWCHYRAARTKHGWRTPLSGDKGLPDYIAIRGERLIFIELKTDTGVLRPEQRDWIAALEVASGVETYVWRPRDDWAEITEILRRGPKSAAA